MEMQAVVSHKVGAAVDDLLLGLLGIFPLGAEVNQLIGAFGIVKMNGVGEMDEIPPAGGVLDVKTGVDGIPAGVVDLLATALHLGRAALGLFQIVCDHGGLRVGGGVILHHVAHGGGGKDAVFEGHVSNGQRLKDMRVMGVHSARLL